MCFIVTDRRASKLTSQIRSIVGEFQLTAGKMNRITISRIILFFCCLFSYCTLIRPAAATNSTAAKTWYVCVSGYDKYTYTYGFESGIYNLCNKLAGPNKENLIIISPDTAAYHAKNYLPGILVHGEIITDENSPPDVYSNITVTYNSKDMTKKLFYAILSGDKKAAKRFGGEKVVESGPQDTIILVFINIGAYGVMTLTNNKENDLYAEEFIPFIEDLKEKKKFKKMLILMEGHQAGTMFDGYICEDCNILVMTNGGKKDPLEFCDYNSDVSAFTSTCYTYYLVNYLESLEEAELKTFTLFDIFHQVRLETKWGYQDSVSNLYGHLDMGNLLLKEFFTFNK